MTDLFPRAPKPAVGETRTLLVHPVAWTAIESYLRSVRIALVRIPTSDDDSPRYAMTPMDGPWGGESDAA